MPELIIVTGPPGAGKSTVSAALVELFEPSVLVAGDDFFRFLRRGALPPWQPEAHEQNIAVIEAAAAAAGRLAEHGTVVYDGVLGPWLLPAFAAIADASSLHYVVLLPSLDVCLQRVRMRTSHEFSDTAASRHMYQQFTADLPESRHVVVDAKYAPVELAHRIHAGLLAGSYRWELPPRA